MYLASQGFASPLLARVEQYEAVVKACEKLSNLACDKYSGAGGLGGSPQGNGDSDGKGDELVLQSGDFAVEALLWMAECCEQVCLSVVCVRVSVCAAE